jgi:hypothetical protein
MAEEIRSGVWRHYSGKHYLVLGVARNTETDEELVIYIPLYEHSNGGRPLQARPASMWREKVGIVCGALSSKALGGSP